MATKKSKSNANVGGARLLVKKPGETTFKPVFVPLSAGKDTPTDFTQITRRDASKDAQEQGTKPTRKPATKSVAKPAVKQSTSSTKKSTTYTQTKKPVAKPTIKQSTSSTKKPVGKIKINGKAV